MKEEHSICRLPSFVIIGAAKSGTTSLAHWLNLHPHIFIPKRELNYFAFADDQPQFIKQQSLITSSFQDYQANYLVKEAGSHAVSGEKSVSYLYTPWTDQVIQNILKYLPLGFDTKIIAILRQPVERMYSQYIYNTAFDEKLSFEEAIHSWGKRKADGWVPAYDYFGGSYYADAIRNYQRHFKHMRVYLFEDLKTHPEALLKDVFNFLDVEDDFLPESEIGRHNISGVPNSSFTGRAYQIFRQNKYLQPIRGIIPKSLKRRFHEGLKTRIIHKPPLNPLLKATLTAVFKEDITQLENCIERDLSHWLNS